jgi:histidyl-tRNA synthetase
MVFGEEEVAQGTVTLKPLRSRDEQMTLDREGLNKFLAQLESLAQDVEE